MVYDHFLFFPLSGGDIVQCIEIQPGGSIFEHCSEITQLGAVGLSDHEGGAGMGG